MSSPNGWTVLVYRIPAQPTRLRLAIWRRLQKMGAFYLQDAVCLLPDRPDLTENLTYVAGTIEEMGGTCHLFRAETLLPGGSEEIVVGFRALADTRLSEIGARLEQIQEQLAEADDMTALNHAEESLKQQRIAYLHAQKRSYFGGTPEREAEVEAKFEQLKRVLDEREGK